jgi:hypothetical protein
MGKRGTGMNRRTTEIVEFDALRPRLLALIEQHRTARTDDERAQVLGRLEEVFLATAWHVAQDLLENGWKPGFVSAPPATVPAAALRVVGGTDAA